MASELQIGFSGKFCVVEADRVRTRPLDRISWTAELFRGRPAHD